MSRSALVLSLVAFTLGAFGLLADTARARVKDPKLEARALVREALARVEKRRGRTRRRGGPRPRW